MRHKLYLQVFVAIISLNFLVAGAQVMTFERAIPGKLSQTTIYDIVQDKDGFVWLATRDGLWKFDGYSTLEYRYAAGDTTSISSSFVRSLHIDRQGNLWVGTIGGGLNRYIREYDCFERFVHEKDNYQSLSHNDVLHIYQDRFDDIWVCTEDGFNKLNKEANRFTRYYLEFNPSKELQNRAFLICMEDSRGNFWVGSFFRGLFLFDRKHETYEHVDLNKSIGNDEPLKEINLWTLHEDRKGMLWVGTHKQGIFRYNMDTGKSERFHITGKNQYQISSNIIYKILEDQSGRMWIGTDWGVNIHEPATSTTKNYSLAIDNPWSISNKAIWAIMEDRAGTVWLGGWEGFADKWDRQSKQFFPRFSDGIYPPAPIHINTMVEYKDGRLLVGTDSGMFFLPGFRGQEPSVSVLMDRSQKIYFQGDYLPAILTDSRGYTWVASNNGLRRFKDNPAHITSYTSDQADTGWLKSNFITALLEDSQNNIWVATQNGLNLFEPLTNTFKWYQSTPFVVGSLSHKNVTCLYEDRNDIIWAGTNNGLNRLNIATNLFTSFQHEHNNPRSLGNGPIRTIYHDSRGILWVGTSSGLSAAVDLSGIFRNFTMADGLPGNLVSAIVEDDNGILWISTDVGLSRVEVGLPENLKDIQKLDTLQLGFTNFNTSDGLLDMGFKQGSFCRLASGEILFGGTYGITSFSPESLKINQFIPPVRLIDLKIMNRSIKPGKDKRLLDKHISIAEGIRLNHEQSVVTFDFVALNFTSSDRNQYAYILEGFDQDWTFCGNRRSATYTNLNPGDYVFMVKASNNDGVWNEEPSTLKVKVLPPPWKTWQAFVMYILILSATVVGFAQLIIAKQKAESRFKLEKLESDKIKEMNYFKSVFFTNISHEFRTPLTLIIAPFSDLVKRTDISEGLREQMKLIQKNALRMLRLINQLLDISKVEAGHIKLRVTEGNIVEFIYSMYDVFKIKAVKEGIDYRFYTSHDEIRGYFDADKIEKISYNLLSNAFKYVPKGGRVDMLLFLRMSPEEESYLELIIQDNGPGIPVENQKKIFERFFSDSELRSPWQSSTGIGLSLANQLVLIHKGRITLESEPNKGSRFIVKLPISRKHYTENEIAPEMPDYNSEMDQVRTLIEHESGSIQPVTSLDKSLPIALVVEDNPDVREYISCRISGIFQVIPAEDGQEGFELATSKIPDIILSDLMMPGVDGFEFCRMIKLDERTSHIPFILLTAKTGEDAQVEGFELGADAYIPKPFQVEFLITRMNNLIESRNKLRQIFGKRLTFEPSEVSMPSIDENFINKVIQIIEKRIADPEFSVEILCYELNMSRSQAFRKLKAITDFSPLKFIRMIRVKRAAQILSQKSHFVSEVAFMVGFSDMNYFRRCFKEQFGVTPSMYLENLDSVKYNKLQ